MYLTNNITNSLANKSWNYIQERGTSWNHIGQSYLSLTETEELTNIHAISRIKELVENLAEAPKIKSVRAIALRFPNLHWIDFELEYYSETELDSEEWNKLQDIVIDYEWQLRDDSGEKWYFHAQPVSQFSTIREGARVIDIYKKKQISSSNLTSNLKFLSM